VGGWGGGGARTNDHAPSPCTHNTTPLHFSNPLKVLGHAKTVSVLLGGWALFGDVISARQAFGMAVAVSGMVAYGVATAPPATAPVPAAPGPASSRLTTTSPRTRAASLSPRPNLGGGENVAPAAGGVSPGKASPARGLVGPSASQPLVDFNKLAVAAAGSSFFGPMLKAVGLGNAMVGGKDDDGFKIRAAHGNGNGLGTV